MDTGGSVSIKQSFWLLSERLKNASQLGWLVIAEVWLPAFMLCVLGVGILREGSRSGLCG
eukprot:1914433-Amphidinium_carterae.2